MPQCADGTVVKNATVWSRLLQSIPASYVVWMDGSQAMAESLLKGGTDYTTGTDTTVINAALAATPSGSRVHLRGPHTYSITAPLTPTTETYVTGDGPSTKLQQAGNVNIFTLTDKLRCGIMNMRLRGVKASYTLGAGIEINTSVYSEDLKHELFNLFIDNFPKQGVYIHGDSREVYGADLYVGGNGENGFVIYGGNHSFSNCTAGGNTYAGFDLRDGLSTYRGLKSWSNTTYGVFLGSGCNADKIDALCYDNFNAGVCVEPNGGTPNNNTVNADCFGNAKGFWIKGGTNNLFTGKASIKPANPGTQADGVHIDDGTGNKFDIESYTNDTNNWVFDGGTSYLKNVLLVADPAVARLVEGSKWYDTTNHLLKYFDGTNIKTIATV